jgi:hypothetical protein
MDTVSQEHIDRLVLRAASTEWRKVAMIIALVLNGCEREGMRAGEDEIAGRIVAMAEAGKLAAQGDLSKWRHSEVRLSTGGSPMHI